MKEKFQTILEERGIPYVNGDHMENLRIKREDGKVFEVSNQHDGYHIIENRGLDGRFEAVRSDILWSRIEPFKSRIQAYAWLKKNVECLL